ncbi:hypothetical protein [Maridesulfovibrio sp.]|uniref:hypothetical protein n=1 Tax=Maridesulfovibrio sp. TaxID=2795000 RepID=UPI003BAD8759
METPGKATGGADEVRHAALNIMLQPYVALKRQTGRGPAGGMLAEHPVSPGPNFGRRYGIRNHRLQINFKEIF